jgi:hypothetical protein
MMASLKKKEADDASRGLAETCHRITRVVRKPHGWKPVWEEVSEPPGEVFEDDEEAEVAAPRDEPRVALRRKHEKKRARFLAMRPPAFVRILRDVLGEG